MTTDNLLLSDTHHDESTACQVKSILLQIGLAAFAQERGVALVDLFEPGKPRRRRSMKASVAIRFGHSISCAYCTPTSMPIRTAARPPDRYISNALGPLHDLL